MTGANRREVVPQDMQDAASLVSVRLAGVFGDSVRTEVEIESEGDDDSPWVLSVSVYATPSRSDETTALVGASIIEDGEIQVGVEESYFTFFNPRSREASADDAAKLIVAFLSGGAQVCVRRTLFGKRVVRVDVQAESGERWNVSTTRDASSRTPGHYTVPPPIARFG